MKIIVEFRPSSGKSIGQLSQVLSSYSKMYGCINNVLQVKSLVDKLEPALASLSVEVKRTSLLALSILVDGNLQSAFNTLVNQACNANNTKIKTEVKLEHSQSSSSSSIGSSGTSLLRQKQLAASAHCYSEIGNEDVLNHSSKRAKTMLSASQSDRASGSSATAALLASVHQSSSQSTTTGPSKRPDFLSQLKSIDSMQLSFPTSNQTRVSSSNKSMLVDKRVQCIMCQETATDASAARCGHLGCEVCWKQWLKVNESCPLCRKPASTSTITRVIVKKSVV